MSSSISVDKIEVIVVLYITVHDGVEPARGVLYRLFQHRLHVVDHCRVHLLRSRQDLIRGGEGSDTRYIQWEHETIFRCCKDFAI